MFSIRDLYYEYQKQTPLELKTLLENELGSFLGAGYTKVLSSLRKCIALTEKYINHYRKEDTSQKNPDGEVLRKSGEPYINHALRVALLLIHERLFDTDILFAAIMHDLFEDTTYSYEQAAADFNPQVAELIQCVTDVSKTQTPLDDTTLTPAEIDYFSIIQKCRQNPMAYYIKFADRLDDLMTLDVMPVEKQEVKIEEARKYLLDLVCKFGATRFESYIRNAIFKISENIKNDGSPNYYKVIDKRLAELWAFQSTKPAYKKLRQVFSVKSNLFRDVRIIRPSIAEIYAEIANNGGSFHTFKQEEIPYEVYFITNNEDTPPKLELVLKHFFNSKLLQGFYISLITCDGFEMHDNINNKYIVHFITGVDFNKKIHGSMENKITITDPWTLDDDLSSNDRIAVYTPDLDEVLLLKDSTVIDFAFRIHKEIGARMIGAKVNDKMVPLHRRLQPKDKVEIITSKYPANEIDVAWLMYCKTKNAKREICKLVNAKLQAMVKKVDQYEQILKAKNIEIDD